MATLAFFAAGSALGGSLGISGTLLGLGAAQIGGALGGVVGNLLDNTIIFPMLFGRQHGEGARINEINVSGTEGNGIPNSLGDRCIVDGQIIDLGDLIEEESESGGKGGGGGGSSTSYKYFTSHVAVSFGKTFNGYAYSILKIWANGQVIFDGTDFDTEYLERAFVYYGTDTQLPNSVLEEHHGGAGTVPAFRGTCYAVFQKLALAGFGNAIPQFRALIKCQNGISVREALLRVHEEAGIPRANVDVSRVPSCLRAISMSGPVPAAQYVEAMMVAHRLVRRETTDKIVYFPRGGEDVVEIDAEDLGAAPEGDQSKAIEVKDDDLLRLPTHCTVSFLDPDADSQRGSVLARRASAGPQSVKSINIPMAISSARAKQLANEEIFRGLVERQKVKLSLPPRYLFIEENDIVETTYKGRKYAIRVGQVERGANYQLVIEGVLVENQVWDSAVTADVTTPPDDTVYVPPTLAWEVMDLPPLTTDHAAAFTVYSAAACQDPRALWAGATVYSSPDESAWSLLARRSSESTIGKATTVLASGPIGIWDRGNTLDVEMFDGELSSAPEYDVLNGSNWLLVGNEIVGFSVATLLGTTTGGARQYRLSVLARGLRDTADGVATHALNERVVRLNTTSLDASSPPYAQLGTSRKFRGVPTGATVESQTSKTVLLSGRTLRPFSPADVRGTRDVSNNLAITWRRRSRAPSRLFQAPLALDDQRVYDVVIKVGPTVVRTERVVDAEVYDYSAAAQTTDGITPGDPVDVELYQISATVGRGNRAAATV